MRGEPGRVREKKNRPTSDLLRVDKQQKFKENNSGVGLRTLDLEP